MDLSGLDQIVEMIVYLDPPRHGPMRQVANKKFLESSVRARIEEIERIAAEIVDQASTGGAIAECDFVDLFAASVPRCGDLMGPRCASGGVAAPLPSGPTRSSARMIRSTDVLARAPSKPRLRARGEIHRYFKRMVEQRREDPKDDFVTQLVQSEIDGVPAHPTAALAYCELLVEAGTRPPEMQSPAGCRPSASIPHQWEKLQAHPELLPDAVEEILRWVTPISYFARTATQDCELQGAKDPRRGQSGPVLGIGQSRRGGIRGSVRIPHRSSTRPARRVRLRPAPLHGCPRCPRRVAGDVQPA